MLTVVESTASICYSCNLIIINVSINHIYKKNGIVLTVTTKVIITVHIICKSYVNRIAECLSSIRDPAF